MQNLLEAKDIATVENLELLAKKVVEGFLAGANRNLRTGQGQEFSQYKAYQPGDDLRQLDWKLLARSGKYYIKESEVETNTTITFLLDASASMRYSEEGLSKLHFAKLLTACLGYLANQQGDLLSLVALNTLEIVQLPPKRSASYFKYFLNELLQVKAEEEWPTGKEVPMQKGKGMVICFSDMYENKTEISDVLKMYAAIGKEVMLFQLFGAKEMTLDFAKANTFRDLESKQVIQTNTKKLKALYSNKLEAFISNLKDDLLGQGITYQKAIISEDVGSLLQAFLKQR